MESSNVFERLFDSRVYAVGIPWIPSARKPIIMKVGHNADLDNLAEKHSHYQWFSVKAKSKSDALRQAKILQTESSEFRRYIKPRKRSRNYGERNLTKSQKMIKVASQFRKIGATPKEAWSIAKQFQKQKEILGLKNPVFMRSIKRIISNLKKRNRCNLPGWRQNPDNSSMVKIYDHALETHARKGKDSAYPEEEFVHNWDKSNTRIIGLPKGTKVHLPDGDVYELTSRDILMDNAKGKDLWDLFKQ